MFCFFLKNTNLKVEYTRCIISRKVLATTKTQGTTTSPTFTKCLRLIILVDWKIVRSWFVFTKWIAITSFMIIPLVTALKTHTICVCFNVLIRTWKLCIAWKIIWINGRGKLDDFTTGVFRYLTKTNKIIDEYKLPITAKKKKKKKRQYLYYFPLFDSTGM